MQALAPLYGIAALPETPLDPLQQLRHDLLQAVQLHIAVELCVKAFLPARAIQVEMQVAAILGWMEHHGMGEVCLHLACIPVWTVVLDACHNMTWQHTALLS